jgi:hypothetical protein
VIKKQILSVALVLIASLTQATTDQERAWDEQIYNDGKSFKMKTSDAFDIINSNHQGNLPEGIKGQLSHSNNCLAITIFGGRLFAAWRSSPTHFASKKTKVFMMSAPVTSTASIEANQTFTWQMEQLIQLERDAREPYFLSMQGKLYFYFFQAGTNPIAFQPNQMWRKEYLGSTGNWTEEEPWGQTGEIAWQYNIENGTAYAGSYAGNHYDFFALGDVSMMLNKSKDGVNWEPVDKDEPVSYVGGGSELGWGFDLQGHFWGVVRNEDGDESGWGSRVAHGYPG